MTDSNFDLPAPQILETRETGSVRWLAVPFLIAAAVVFLAIIFNWV